MRKGFCGYDKDGIPLWLLHHIRYYGHIAFGANLARIQRRLIRMVKVNSALRRRTLGGAEMHRLNQDIKTLVDLMKELGADGD